jgi:transketolase
MALQSDERQRLLDTARRIRERIVDIVFHAGSGHIGAALSQTDILVALYHGRLRHDPARPDWPERDRFVLSKGHGGLGLAAILADLGYFPADELAGFGATGARLGMHMDRTKVPGIEVSTGSLGHGLGTAVGMALGAKTQGLDWRTWCLISDGELFEGSIWEAAIAAAGFGLDRLTVLVDRNRLTMDGFTEMEMPLEPLAEKWAAFGWRTWHVDGHDFDALCQAMDQAMDQAMKPAAGDAPRPAVIIAETVKGKGVDFMENQADWHYGALDSAMYERARKSIAAWYRDRGRGGARRS